MRLIVVVVLVMRSALGLVGSAGRRLPRRRLTVAMMAGGWDFDVVVIGGGHAGCEAAAAAARSGATVALVTQRVDTVGEMSCNPSIGGIGKGHLVREIDALGGVMGECADAAAIHYRVLNRRKGPAVWGPRVQADRDLYKAAVQARLVTAPYTEGSLEIVQASAEDLILEGGRVVGVRASDPAGGPMDIRCHACVITTGTFLRGRCFVGHESYAAGRHVRDSPTNEVEAPSNGLARTLEETLALPLDRLKTGTPPRIRASSIDWDECTPQPSEDPFHFSYLPASSEDGAPPKRGPVVDCFQTQTNEGTHDIVRARAHTLAPPSLTGTGPRYCPSIYKKVERFGERSSHNVWLEPEGLNSDLVYPNGLSGAFPVEVQYEILHSIRGLGRAEIVAPGYDVEYDFVDPRSLDHTLAVKKAPGLYLAGQICGTTGYEEAGALGIVAGANAGLFATSRTRFVVGREEGYIGVLVDDLVTRGTLEPYRMFTSRAEYRLSLRADNADLRLTQRGAAAGLVSDRRRDEAERRDASLAATVSNLRACRLAATAWYDALGWDTNVQHKKRASDGRQKTAFEVLEMPHADLDAVLGAARNLGRSVEVPLDVRDSLVSLSKYDAYLSRQDREMELYRRNEAMRIPPDLDYIGLPQISAEEAEKLHTARPLTFADASKISGITPSSLVFLYQIVSSREHRQQRARDREAKAANNNDDDAQARQSLLNTTAAAP